MTEQEGIALSLVPSLRGGGNHSNMTLQKHHACMQLRCKYWAIFVWVYIWLYFSCLGGVLSKPYSNSLWITRASGWRQYPTLALSWPMNCVYMYVCGWQCYLSMSTYDIAGYDSPGVHEQGRSQGVPHLTKTKVSSTGINPICEIHKPWHCETSQCIYMRIWASYSNLPSVYINYLPLCRSLWAT